ncbi:hypothetical protein GCM10022254_69510 [Actinomadura meridiana]|uniref:Integral membrane bound transporter domain-containing protein n=1 Tax=Actinomadura meridiana TaxID=559626 RepID=A0ABP8CMV0_9ACTN
MCAVLATYASALAIERRAHLHVDVVVQAVVLALSAARVQRRVDRLDRLIGFAVLPATAMAATGAQWLMAVHPAVGDTLFVVVIAASIWVRRFGSRAVRAGTLMVLPFVAILVVHGQAAAMVTWHGALWSAVIALVACAWVTVLQLLAAQAGFGDIPTRTTVPPVRPGARRLSPSTRLALQMGTALAAAFVVGRTLWPQHWAWPVLTAFIVCSGARGRGDVLLKSLLRTLGAGVGTLAAALIAGSFAPHADGAVVVIFVVLAVAAWLREASYVYWAGGVTAGLSLLYDWFGEPPGDLLRTRLAGIAVGGALGLAASWLVLPIRTGQVLRRRAADAVAALGGVLAAACDSAGVEKDELWRRQRGFEHAVGQLEQIARPLRARRTLESRWAPGRPHQADAIDLIRGCLPEVRTLTEALPELRPLPPCVTDLGVAVSANALAALKTIGRRPEAHLRQATASASRDPDSTPAITALEQINHRLTDLTTVFSTPPGPR